MNATLVYPPGDFSLLAEVGGRIIMQRKLMSNVVAQRNHNSRTRKVTLILRFRVKLSVET